MCRVCGLAVFALALALVAGPGGRAGDPPPKKKLPPAIAAALKSTPEEFLKLYDKNKDGVLTLDEMPPALVKAFARYDANGDGKLDRAEVAQLLKGVRALVAQQEKGPAPAQVEALVDKLLAQFDTNKDGKISKAEAKGRLAESFAQFDTNKDGYLDRKELQAAAARLLAGPKGGFGKGGFGKGGFGKGGGGPDFDALDRNADGRLTRDEVRGSPLEKLFDEIDTNRDGRISRAEFEEYLEKSAKKKQ
jgi:Ca2+-binding EF-hand superfamily protein